jgi:hypothetical protein
LIFICDLCLEFCNLLTTNFMTADIVS